MTTDGQEREENTPSQHNHEFPWGVEVCALKHPKTGELLPGKLPTSPGGIIISCDAQREKEATAVAECVVASLFDQLPANAIDTHVVDFGIKKRFQHISRLKNNKLYTLHQNRAEASRCIEEIEKLAIERHHGYLSDEVVSISAHNRTASHHEKYSAIVVNLADYPTEGSDITRVSRLLESCFDAGFYVIILNSPVEQGNDDQQKQRTAFLAALRSRYPEIVLSAEAAAGELVISPAAEATRDLLGLCNRFSLSPGLSDVNLAALVDGLVARAETGGDDEQDFLSIPIGTMPDGRATVSFNLGKRSGCYSAFVLGMAGTGKTTLLNNLIVAMAEQYTSEELRLYLMDYKDGVEFQAFDSHPNCEKIFLDNSDLNAATALLEEFVGKIAERGRLFRDAPANVNEIDRYNQLYPERKLPRLVLIIDEVHRLFDGGFKQAAQFNKQLIHVLKQGRAFGVHIILATQTLSGCTIDRELMSQIKLRISFRLADASDCGRIFTFGNEAALGLAKYHLIYNQDAGFKQGNVLCRCNPPVDIESRIQEVLARTPPALVLRPVVVQSPATQMTGLTAPVAAPADGLPHWATEKKPTVQDEETEKQKALFKEVRDHLLQEEKEQAATCGNDIVQQEPGETT